MVSTTVNSFYLVEQHMYLVCEGLDLVCGEFISNDRWLNSFWSKDFSSHFSSQEKRLKSGESRHTDTSDSGVVCVVKGASNSEGFAVGDLVVDLLV